jgi:glycosyltransferase involved in cell wall biosynthesis
MRILHVIQSVDPRSGGPSHALRAVVRGQVAAGHDVSLLATVVQANGPWQAIEAYRRASREDGAFRGCDLNLLDAWGRRKPWSSYAFSPGARKWLRQRLTDTLRSPQVVHIHGVFSHVASLAAVESRRRGVPYIVRPCGILDAHCLTLGSARLKRLFLHLLLRRHLQAAAVLHATSAPEADELARWVPRERIRTLPLGVEVKCRAEPCVVQRFLARFRQLQRKRIVLFLGRIATKKRPELLVEAIACLRGEMPDLVLLIVGEDDGGMPAVEAAVRRHGLSDAVVHAGFLQGEEKDAALAAASLFALPSLDENFGVAVVEAMACELPVLVTPGVAAGQYVEVSGGGLVVQGTAEALALGIRRILTSDPRQMGRDGREFVEQHLSWPAALAQLDELYRELVQRALSTSVVLGRRRPLAE